MQSRQNLERAALLAYENQARKSGLRVVKGQGSDNRLQLGGNLNFQFGDLRVDTDTHHVVIETESAVGVTNLAKYWYYLADNNPSSDIKKPIILIHLFRQVSTNDYGAHMALWDFYGTRWNELLERGFKLSDLHTVIFQILNQPFAISEIASFCIERNSGSRFIWLIKVFSYKNLGIV